MSRISPSYQSQRKYKGTYAFEEDFQIPEWIVVPESVSSRYERLSESGREDVHRGIEQALAWLKAEINSVNSDTTLKLKQYTIYG